MSILGDAGSVLGGIGDIIGAFSGGNGQPQIDPNIMAALYINQQQVQTWLQQMQMQQQAGQFGYSAAAQKALYEQQNAQSQAEMQRYGQVYGGAEQAAGQYAQNVLQGGESPYMQDALSKAADQARQQGSQLIQQTMQDLAQRGISPNSPAGIAALQQARNTGNQNYLASQRDVRATVGQQDIQNAGNFLQMGKTGRLAYNVPGLNMPDLVTPGAGYEKGGQYNMPGITGAPAGYTQNPWAAYNVQPTTSVGGSRYQVQPGSFGGLAWDPSDPTKHYSVSGDPSQPSVHVGDRTYYYDPNP